MELSLCFKPPESLIFKQNPFFCHFNSVQKLSTTSLQFKIGDSHCFLRSSNFSSFNQISYNRSRKRGTFVVYARKNQRRSTLRVSTKAALECAFLIASSLKIIPEPVSSIIKQGFEGGNGGGGGFGNFWNGFRGGDGWFDGWRGGRKRKFGILGLLALILVSVFFVVLMLGKEFKGFGELGLGILGLLFLVVLERDWKRGIKGWTFGFCSCALMVVLGFKREDLQKWIQGSKVHYPVMDLFRSKRRRRFL
ncbi:hypothetical protein AQUCO_05400141v1 [Aquilegia coerulea]|uniref:Transmembrane protein n=1 Tax=Aquilegia coerulea TaxID=218851 RepID=A0A2G5CJ36_AQUCA|nr:hypothetical protein AQUCO_05400141v1 [Aquilegia coerulea]